MAESSRKPLFDLRKLNASLPVPPLKDSSMKILVLGANDDFIVVKRVYYLILLFHFSQNSAGVMLRFDDLYFKISRSFCFVFGPVGCRGA